MSARPIFTLLVLCALLGACANGPSARVVVDEPRGAAAAAPAPPPVDNRDTASAPAAPAATPKTPAPTPTPNTTDSQRDAPPADGEKFTRLQLGMDEATVQGLIGPPDVQFGYETGKRWIPFYSGSDVKRRVLIYHSEGCLLFTGKDTASEPRIELVRIEDNPLNGCH